MANLPDGWIYIPKMTGMDTIEVRSKELVICRNCKHSYSEGFVHVRLLCEKHPELGDLPENWYCADCDKEEADEQ